MRGGEPRRRSTFGWIAAAVALTLALRAPWWHSALGRDEGGVSFVALSWHGSHPFPYGPYFLDRPPLLVALFRLAASAGDGGVRALGAVAAAAAVAACAWCALRVGGRRAAAWTAMLAALLVSSVAIDSVFTPAELLAIVPSAASLALLIGGLDDHRPWRMAAAGALGVVALLVKQSFMDALAAGGIALAWLVVIGGRLARRRAAGLAVAYAAGVGGR